VSIRRAFLNLVNACAERRNLLLVPEIYVKGKKGNSVRPDGVLKNETRFASTGSAGILPAKIARAI